MRAISAWLPWAITPLMMIGGAFLCYEGVEKLAHRFLHSRDEDEQRKAERVKALADEKVDMVAWEKDKVKGAIRTDFILSAEIIVLSLGVVSSAPFLNQVSALVVIALAMTVFVYGLVAGIVKLDALGLYLSRKGAALAAVGRGLLVAAPWLMKFLSVAGTAAMFLVGGGILEHSIAPLHHDILAMGGDGSWGWLINALGNVIVGVVIGAVVLAAVTGFQKLRGAKPAH